MNKKGKIRHIGLYMGLSMTLCFLIFPFVPYFLDAGGGHVGVSCAPMKGPFIAALVALSVLWVLALMVMAGLVWHATLYFMIIAYWAGIWGIWWLAIGSLVVYCSMPEGGFLPVLGIAVAFAFTCAIIFCFFVFPRLKKVISINPQAFDLSSMQYNLSAPLRRPDGSYVFGAGFFMVSMGVAGAVVARSFVEDVPSIIFGSVAWVIAVLVTGGVSASQCYLAWFSYLESKKAGKPLVVAELK